MHEVLAKCESDPITTRAVDRALLNTNNAMRSALVVTHQQTRTEDKCDFLTEVPGGFGSGFFKRNEKRRGEWPRQTVPQRGLLRSQLLCVRKILETATT